MIRCGHCGNTHHTVPGIKACHGVATVPAATGDTYPCTWLIAVTHDTEDGPYTEEVECGAIAWDWADGRGYGCELGHEHTYAEVRAAEGWDYAADDDEAAALAKHGVEPRDLVYGTAYNGRVAS